MLDQGPYRQDSTPTRDAVALAYSEGDSAPRVVAKGKGLIAQEILRRAAEAGVYVHQSRELVALLMRVDLDDRIPSSLYVAVAELLAWLYRTDQRAAERNSARNRGG